MENSNRWRFDFDRFEQAITPKTRLFMLCNPHNPIGRVYTREELTTMVNAMGYIATLVAFRDCSDWHDALLNYLRANRDCVAQVISQMPNLSIAPVEATYLAWIDVRDAGLKYPIQFFEEAGVGLQKGAEFAGPGFVRLNFGCPRAILEKALNRMASALEANTQNK